MFHRLVTDESSLGLFQKVEKSVLKEEVCLDKHFRNGTTARVGKVFFEDKLLKTLFFMST